MKRCIAIIIKVTSKNWFSNDFLILGEQISFLSEGVMRCIVTERKGERCRLESKIVKKYYFIIISVIRRIFRSYLNDNCNTAFHSNLIDKQFHNLQSGNSATGYE